MERFWSNKNPKLSPVQKNCLDFPLSLGDLTTKSDLYGPGFGQFMLGIYGNAEYNGWLRNLLDFAGYDSAYKWISRADSMRVFAVSISHEWRAIIFKSIRIRASNQVVLTGMITCPSLSIHSMTRSIHRFLSVWPPNIHDIYIIYTALLMLFTLYPHVFFSSICRFDSMMCQLSKSTEAAPFPVFCWLYNISHQIISL